MSGPNWPSASVAATQGGISRNNIGTWQSFLNMRVYIAITQRICILLLLLLVLSCFSNACSGNGDAGNGDGANGDVANGDVDSVPELGWVAEPGSLIAERHYQAGTFLSGYTVYNYIEITGGSGEVQLDVELAGKGAKTVTFSAEEGKSYRVALLVGCSGYVPTEYRPLDEHVYIFSSPSAGSSDEQRVAGYFNWNDLALEKLDVSPWEYTSPEPATLTVRVYPEGSGSISDHLGKLTHHTEDGEVTRYVGTYDYGTEVILTASPDEGYSFGHWGGTENELPAHLPLGIIDGTAETSTIIMRTNLDLYITAYFSDIGAP